MFNHLQYNVLTRLSDLWITSGLYSQLLILMCIVWSNFKFNHMLQHSLWWQGHSFQQCYLEPQDMIIYSLGAAAIGTTTSKNTRKYWVWNRWTTWCWRRADWCLWTGRNCRSKHCWEHKGQFVHVTVRRETVERQWEKIKVEWFTELLTSAVVLITCQLYFKPMLDNTCRSFWKLDVQTRTRHWIF
jgi:hypothetical protein